MNRSQQLRQRLFAEIHQKITQPLMTRSKVNKIKMEEFKYRLNHPNAAVAANVCDRIYTAIIEKLENGSDQKVPELDLLWNELKTSDKALCCNNVAKVISKLAFGGTLDPKDVMTSFLTSAPHTAYPEGIVSTIGDFLWGMEPVADYYGIAKHQHPFIALLRSSPGMWPLVSNQLQMHLVEDSTKAIQIHRPVYVFAFCDPHTHAHFSALRTLLMRDLLEAKMLSGVDGLMHHLIMWLPLEKCANHVFEEYLHLIVIPWIRSLNNENVLPYLSSLVLQKIRRGLNPRMLFKEMRRHCAKLDNVSIIILAQVLDQCPFDLIESVLSFCVEKFSLDLDPLAYGTFFVSLLQLMVQNNRLVPEVPHLSVDLAHKFTKIRSSNAGSKLLANDVSETFHFDQIICQAIQAINIVGDDQFKILCSKLLLSEDRISTISTLDKVETLVRKEPKANSSRALTVILHKLSRTSDNVVTLKLIEFLPTLAKDKTCVASVLAFINRFESVKSLNYLRLQLLFKLWKSEPRTYIYLHRAIEQDFQAPNEKVKLKYLMTKVNVICQICQENAAQHGADLLRPLNDIMNEGIQNMTLISHALKGITGLCKEGIIDVVTTIKVLSPRFKSDARLPISKAFYSLLAVAPTFAIDSDEYISFLQSLLTMMWKNAYDDNLSTQIRNGILRAMSHFDLNHHQLQMLPDFVCRPEDDEAAGISGHCWIQILEHDSSSSINAALETLVTSLVNQEVMNLPRGVYHLSQAMKNKLEENANFNFLPDSSILRAAISQLIAKSGNDKSLMKILSSFDQRPLPPFDWRIVKLALMSNAKSSFISLLAKQSAFSYSAKSILESLLQEWSTCEVALDIMPHVKHLFNGVNHKLIRPFIGESLILWHQSQIKDKSCLGVFQSLFSSYVQIVVSENEIDTSSYTDDIIDAIINLHQELSDESDKEFFYDAILDLPSNVLERLIANLNTLSALNIRRNLAVKKNRLCLPALNDIIDALAKEETDCDVDQNNIKNILDLTPTKQLKSWILEMMGQLLFLLRQNCSFWTLQFMLEMFTLGISSLAKDDGKGRGTGNFPELARLLAITLQIHPDLGPQIAEWLVELYNYKPILGPRSKVLKKCFLTIKQCDGFKESTIWGKLTLLK